MPVFQVEMKFGCDGKQEIITTLVSARNVGASIAGAIYQNAPCDVMPMTVVSIPVTQGVDIVVSGWDVTTDSLS